MKATGIVRRIDNLGRIVIPKEIRKNLRIKTSDNLEIYINTENNIVLKKYNHLDKLKDLAISLCKTLNNQLKKNIIITNTNEVITAEGSNKTKYINKPLTQSLITNIMNRKEITSQEQSTIKIIPNEIENNHHIVMPIIADSEVVGSIIVLSPQYITEEEHNNIKLASKILINYIEQ